MCKITKVSVPKETEVKKLFIDELGHLKPPSVHGFRYVLMIVDELNKFKVVKFWRTRSEALEKFQEFIAEHGIPKVVMFDNGKEFSGKFFQTVLH